MPIFRSLLVNKVPNQMALGVQWPHRSQQNIKICILTKFEHPVPIYTQFAPIFGVPLVNKVPHLVGIFKNQQRGVMRHVPIANCTHFCSCRTKFKASCQSPNERAGAHGPILILPYRGASLRSAELVSEVASRFARLENWCCHFFLNFVIFICIQA